jgi:nucleoside-diphosphate-sugar epimerase
MRHQNTLLVTGAFGFLGSCLGPILMERIDEGQILAVGRTPSNAHWIGSSKVQFIVGDLNDPKLWAALPKTITHVFHLAAVIPRAEEERKRASIAKDNLLPLLHLIEFSRAWPNLQQVIFSSTISVYAKTGLRLTEDSLKGPPDFYGASKLAGEHLLHCLESDGVRVVHLRYSSLYGYGQYQGTVLPVMVNKAIQGEEIPVYGEGKRTQDFLYVEDAAVAIVLAYEKQARGVFNIGSGISISMRTLAEMVSRIFANNMVKIIFSPDEGNLDPGFKVDISKAKRELNYDPSFKVKDGLLRLKREMRV